MPIVSIASIRGRSDLWATAGRAAKKDHDTKPFMKIMTSLTVWGLRQIKNDKGGQCAIAPKAIRRWSANSTAVISPKAALKRMFFSLSISVRSGTMAPACSRGKFLVFTLAKSVCSLVRGKAQGTGKSIRSQNLRQRFALSL